jgi:hypothetical protein
MTDEINKEVFLKVDLTSLLYESPNNSLGKCFVLLFIGTETLGNYLERVIDAVSLGKNQALGICYRFNSSFSFIG